MNFKLRYGPTAAVLGVDTSYARQFARALASRGLDIVLLSENIQAASKLAAELTRHYRIIAQTGSLSDPNVTLQNSNIRLLVSTTDNVDVACQYVELFSKRGKGGLILVKHSHQFDDVIERIEDNSAHSLVVHQSRFARKAGLTDTVHRCVELLGRSSSNPRVSSSTGGKRGIAGFAAVDAVTAVGAGVLSLL